MTYPLIAPQLTGPQSAGVYVPQDFSSSGLNIPAYVVSDTATVANTVAYSSFGPFAGEGSVYFPGGAGAAGYIQFPSSVTSLNFDITAQDITIEFWVYAVRTSQPGAFVFRGPTVGSPTSDWQIYQNGYTLVFQGASTATSPQNVIMTINQWNHVAATIQGSTMTLWVNGVSIGTATKSTSTYSSSHPVTVGAGNYSAYYNGYLSNFRFVRGAALYTSTFTPPTGPLQPIQGVTQAGTPYGTVLLLRNAPAPGRVLTQKFAGANSGQVLAFPPAAMTGYTTTLNAGYGQGTYVASASSEYSLWKAWMAFDQGATNFWQIATGTYTANVPYSGLITTIDINGKSYPGEWLQIQLPSSIVLSNYSTTNSSGGAQIPTAWWILGSCDGTNWYLVDERSNQSTSSAIVTNYPISSQAFSYFRIVIRIANNTFPLISEWTLNGTIESVNVTPDGRVGLGVVNPTRALEVAGDLVVSGTVSSGTGLMFRNRIINGDMSINQRGISRTVGSPTALLAQRYTLDRWSVFRSGYAAGGTVAQGTLSNTDLPYINDGLYSFMRIGRTVDNTNTGVIVVSQAMETIESYRFAGRPANLSFYYRTGSAWAGAGVGAVIYGTGTDQAPTNWAAVTAGASALTASLNWTKITLTVNIPINATQTGANFTYTPTTNPAVANDYIDITGVQLEKGTVATPYEIRPYATELALCQRYYWRLNGPAPIGTVGAWTTTSGYCPITFPVPMRAKPTIGCNTSSPPPAAGTVIVLSNSEVQLWYSGGSQTVTSIRTSSTSITNGEILIVWPTVVTLNGGYLIELPTSKFIEYSAEL
jgi:hypothetical protein